MLYHPRRRSDRSEQAVRDNQFFAMKRSGEDHSLGRPPHILGEPYPPSAGVGNTPSDPPSAVVGKTPSDPPSAGAGKTPSDPHDSKHAVRFKTFGGGSTKSKKDASSSVWSTKVFTSVAVTDQELTKAKSLSEQSSPSSVRRLLSFRRQESSDSTTSQKSSKSPEKMKSNGTLSKTRHISKLNVNVVSLMNPYHLTETNAIDFKTLSSDKFKKKSVHKRSARLRRSSSLTESEIR